METSEILYFIVLLVVLIVIFFRNRAKSKRIEEQDRTIVQLADDFVALRNKILEYGLSDDDIQALRDKYKPEEADDFSSSFTEWKKVFKD